jgi:hypothetical protein
MNIKCYECLGTNLHLGNSVSRDYQAPIRTEVLEPATSTSLNSVERSSTINVCVTYVVSCSGHAGLEFVKMRDPEEVSTMERYPKPFGFGKIHLSIYFQETIWL